MEVNVLAQLWVVSCELGPVGKGCQMVGMERLRVERERCKSQLEKTKKKADRMKEFEETGELCTDMIQSLAFPWLLSSRVLLRHKC